MSKKTTRKPATKAATPKKRPVGRPETDVEWKSIGIRFTTEEKDEIEAAAKRLDLSQSQFIRRGTLDLLAKARTGKVVLSG